MNIGIGITTHNRKQTFIDTFSAIENKLPHGARLVVVDDASVSSARAYWHVMGYSFKYPYYYFDENVGIARAKNKCLELLEDCDHIFLFDDDIYPVVDRWWEPYISSGENHLMYIFKDFATPRKLNDTIELWRNNKIVAWSHARGPMLYLRKEVLQKVGGMNPVYGKWGFEHPDYSNRIFNAGLSSYRYADVIGSDKLFYCHDEHETVVTTVMGKDRLDCIGQNKPVYEANKFSSEYIPYKDKKNIVITTYFTGIPDPQRKESWVWDQSLIAPLYNSVAKHDIELHLVYNQPIPSNELSFGSTYIKASHNPYFQRWISIREYLIANRESIGKVFCVDATDVVMIKDPFPHMVYGKLYTGDEPEALGCQWIRNHHKHVKLVEFINTNATLPLLNAGLLGGDVETVIAFLTQLIDFYFFAEIDTHYHGRPNCGMTDMATFNYIARTKFSDRLSHGKHVNTKFKANEQDNTIAWFKHK